MIQHRLTAPAQRAGLGWGQESGFRPADLRAWCTAPGSPQRPGPASATLTGPNQENNTITNNNNYFVVLTLRQAFYYSCHEQPPCFKGETEAQS